MTTKRKTGSRYVQLMYVNTVKGTSNEYKEQILSEALGIVQALAKVGKTVRLVPSKHGGMVLQARRG